jgi:hypothetical protein
VSHSILAERVVALGAVELRQVVQACRDLGVVGSEGAFPDGECPLGERQREGVVALLAVETGEVVEARRDRERPTRCSNAGY